MRYYRQACKILTPVAAALLVTGTTISIATPSEAASCTWMDGQAKHDTWYYETSSCQQLAGKAAEAELSGNTTIGNFYTILRFGDVESRGSTFTQIVLDRYSGARQSVKWYSPQAGENPPTFDLRASRGIISDGGPMSVDPSAHGTLRDVEEASRGYDGGNRVPGHAVLNAVNVETGVPVTGASLLESRDERRTWTSRHDGQVWVIHRDDKMGATFVTSTSEEAWKTEAITLNVGIAGKDKSRSIVVVHPDLAEESRTEIEEAFDGLDYRGSGLFVNESSSASGFLAKDPSITWRDSVSNYGVALDR